MIWLVIVLSVIIAICLVALPLVYREGYFKGILSTKQLDMRVEPSYKKICDKKGLDDQVKKILEDLERKEND